jgi:hypothetical protein
MSAADPGISYGVAQREQSRRCATASDRQEEVPDRVIEHFLKFFTA